MNSDSPAAVKRRQQERKEHLEWLVKRITELHRDKQRRWPGRKARIQADSEWGRFQRTGEAPPSIEPREKGKI
jgi:hypothetical protein